MGIALATALHSSQVEVHLFVRRQSATAAALSGGLRRSGLFGEARVPASAMHLHDDLDALARLDPDATLVCTKTTATRALAEPLGRALSRTARATPMVICHNGWGSFERFAEHLDPARVFNARVITGFRRLAPAHVEVTVHAAPIRMGHLAGGDAAELAWLCDALRGGGLPCEPSDDIGADLLAKLLYNGLLNPLGALVGVPYGVLAERPDTRATMEALAHEIFAVLRAAGLRTHWPDAPSYLETFFGELLPPTAAHESSMLQDLRAGRPTEVDAITGAVLDLAARHHVEAPVHRALATLVHAAEAQRPTP